MSSEFRFCDFLKIIGVELYKPDPAPDVKFIDLPGGWQVCLDCWEFDHSEVGKEAAEEN